VTHLPALALFNLLLISSATAVESPLSSGSPGMKDWPENAMAVPAMHTVARISFIMIKYLNDGWGPEQEGGAGSSRMCCAMCDTRGERSTESMNDAEDRVGATWVRVCIVCIATGMR